MGDTEHLSIAQREATGHIAGAAFDVFPIEPKGRGDEFVSELRGLPNVILTPHVAGVTHEAIAGVFEQAARNALEFVGVR